MDTSAYSAIKVETLDRVTTLTLNRPEVRNAVNAQLHEELATIWADVDLNADTDVIVLQGSEGVFCAGGDLKWLLSKVGDIVKIVESHRINRKINDGMLALEKPIIAKVDGPAIGLGCTVALSCDFVFATEQSVFADPHVTIGRTAGDGGALLWPQLKTFW